MNCRLLLCIGFLILPVLSAAQSPDSSTADFYVASNGDDSWSGEIAQPRENQTNGPFATLQRAQAAVRALKAEEPNRTRPIVVMVRGGTYFLTKPLTFAPEDSGTLHAPVIYRAYPGEQPVLSGGQRITNWQVDENGWWHAHLEDAANGLWAFSQLFVNNQRRFRPRLPKKGYHHVAQALSPTSEVKGKGHNRFGYAEGDIKRGWANRDHVEVLAFHFWSASRLPIRSIDTEEQAVTLQSHTWTNRWFAQLEKGHRYLVVNVKEALNEPGEWYLDQTTGRLTYIPRKGETVEKAVVIAPRLKQIVRFKGDVERREWVEHIHLKGLTFAHSNWAMPEKGQTYPQAEVGMEAAVNVAGGRHLRIDSCVVRHVGGYGIAFGAGSRYNRVENSELVDLGAGGIKIGHAGPPASWQEVGRIPTGEEAFTSHHTIKNCTIAHGGRLHPAAVGIWIGHSPYNHIEHNEIFDFYYTGISVGWNWGYEPSPAHHNKILYNHIHTIGQGVLSDMSGVYLLGTSPGTEVSHNHIHHIQAHDYGGWGLYTDEGSTGIVMTKNLVHHTKTGGFHQHYGKNNQITNNIFALSSTDQIQRTRAEDHLSFRFTRNIVYYNQGKLLGKNWEGHQFALDYNIYWRANEDPVQFPGELSLEEWQAQRGQDQHSLVVDPRFKDPANGDFRFRSKAPFKKIGFQPFDYTQAGRPQVKVLTSQLPPVPAGYQADMPKEKN